MPLAPRLAWALRRRAAVPLEVAHRHRRRDDQLGGGRKAPGDGPRHRRLGERGLLAEHRVDRGLRPLGGVTPASRPRRAGRPAQLGRQRRATCRDRAGRPPRGRDRSGPARRPARASPPSARPTRRAPSRRPAARRARRRAASGRRRTPGAGAARRTAPPHRRATRMPDVGSARTGHCVAAASAATSSGSAPLRPPARITPRT